MEPLPLALDPPVRRDEAGELRKVGVEIELTGIDVEAIADTVAKMFRGQVVVENDYLARVETELGEFRIEVDLHLLQRIGRRRAEPDGDTGMAATFRDAVASVAERIAPYEMVSPPLPYPELERMDELAGALGLAGGRGTDAGPLLALGLHLNPQVPSSSAESIHAHVRAYAILEPWLRMRSGIDLSRRLTPFVNPYPASYVQRLIEEDAAPPMARLIDDYLRFNPTRNRSLDLLPLLSSIDHDRVVAAVPDVRVKSRPTFHYRLPDSRVGEPGWRVTDDWRLWLVVERVASRPLLLALLARAYAGLLEGSSAASAQVAWADRCERLLAASHFGADQVEPQQLGA